MISPKKKLMAIIILGAIIFILVPVYFIVANNNPGTEGSDFTLCTAAVDQPACYSGDPAPTLNWIVAGASTQASYEIEIDNNSDFTTPEIDTGEVSSSNLFHTVGNPGLSYSAFYYWRVRVKDNFGGLSDWGANDSFTTAPSCNAAPAATNLSVINGNYCATASHFFSWDYSDADGDPQDSFDFQVDDDSGFGSLQVSRMAIPGAGTDQSVVVVNSPGSDQLGYATTYYWRVRVYDGQGADSGWVNGSSFATELHQYPSIDFSWDPSSPSKDEDVQFTDTSTVYGGASKSAWSWIFTDGNPGSSSVQNPIIQFASSGSKQVALQVTDSDGFICSDNSQSVNVGWSLPDWKEILPW